MAFERLRRFLHRPPAERVAIGEAFAWLLVARTSLALVRFQRLAAFLGHASSASPGLNDAEATLVEQAIATAARHTPWQSLCLTQALAATAMLRRRHLRSVTYFGVNKDDAGELTAHAWVRSGPVIVSGADGHDRFAVIATFGSGDAADVTGKVPR